VIGTANWGGAGSLGSLRWPNSDPNLVLTVHDYDPMSFTHQGADWVTPVPPLGVPWDGTYFEKFAARQTAETIQDFATAHDVPVWIGEFGAYSKADTAARGRWAKYNARLFESKGFSWAWWEFKAGFGIYDESAGTWNHFLTDSLLSDDTSILVLPPPANTGANLVVNGEFARASRWQGTASFDLDSGAARVDVPLLSTNAWDIQMTQGPFVLTKGTTYVLQFVAWASRPRSFGGSVGMSVDPWSSYASASGALNARHKTFLTTFVAGKTDSLARVSFDFGADTGTVWLDDVKLLSIVPASGLASPRANRFCRNVYLRRGVLQLEGDSPLGWPSLLLDQRGRVVSRLVWSRSSPGWQARVGSLPPGRYFLPGRSGKADIVLSVGE
jgi:hypothetical protein